MLQHNESNQAGECSEQFVEAPHEWVILLELPSEEVHIQQRILILNATPLKHKADHDYSICLLELVSTSCFHHSRGMVVIPFAEAMKDRVDRPYVSRGSHRKTSEKEMGTILIGAPYRLDDPTIS